MEKSNKEYKIKELWREYAQTMGITEDKLIQDWWLNKMQEERERLVKMVEKDMAIHLQLTEEWTGIKLNGLRDVINPHQERFEALSDLKQKITNPPQQ